MTGDLVAFAAGLAVGVALGMVVARTRGHIPTREEKLVRKVYRHMDEIIGATKNENQLRADLRFAMIHPRLYLRRPWKSWRLLVPHKARQWIADWLWPIPRFGPGTTPLPSDRRIAQYVQHTPDLQTWIIHYSSEAPANHAPFIEWMERGRPVQGGGLAQALGLEWRSGMFLVERNWSEGLVRFTLTRPADVPDLVTADEELV
jgi:hypothetical protein